MSLPLIYTALTATVFAADPPPAGEQLPPPRAVQVEPMPFPGYYRRSAYDVWQAYSVARDQTWQPRVDWKPGIGYYYVYNGKPYLYAPLYQRWYSPSVQGVPYRSYPEMPPVIIEEVLPAPQVQAVPEAKPVPQAKPTSAKKPQRAVAEAPERMPYVKD